MSSDNNLSGLAPVLRALEDSLAAASSVGPVSDADSVLASRLLSTACQWYYHAAQGRSAEEFAQLLEMTTSEACVAATALLHSQSLSPFEFGIWFVASEARH